MWVTHFLPSLSSWRLGIQQEWVCEDPVLGSLWANFWSTWANHPRKKPDADSGSKCTSEQWHLAHVWARVRALHEAAPGLGATRLPASLPFSSLSGACSLSSLPRFSGSLRLAQCGKSKKEYDPVGGPAREAERGEYVKRQRRYKLLQWIKRNFLLSNSKKWRHSQRSSGPALA